MHTVNVEIIYTQVFHFSESPSEKEGARACFQIFFAYKQIGRGSSLKRAYSVL